MRKPFAELPPAVREDLAALTSEGTDTGSTFVFVGGGELRGLLVFLGLLLTAATAFLTLPGFLDNLPTGTLAVAVLLPPTLGAILVRAGLAPAPKPAPGVVRPGVVVTPLAIARTGGPADEVEIRPLDELVETGLTTQTVNGMEMAGWIAFKFKDGQEIRTPWVAWARADAALFMLKHAAHNAAQSPPRVDWLAAIASAGPTAPAPGLEARVPPEPAPAPSGGGFVRAAAIGFAIGVALLAWNRYSVEEARWRHTRGSTEPASYADYVRRAPLGLHAREADDLAFEAATRRRDAAALESYCAGFPAGAHAGEAREAEKRLLAEADDAYRARPPEKRAPGVGELLAFCREKAQVRVPVRFEPDPVAALREWNRPRVLFALGSGLHDALGCAPVVFEESPAGGGARLHVETGDSPAVEKIAEVLAEVPEGYEVKVAPATLYAFRLDLAIEVPAEPAGAPPRVFTIRLELIGSEKVKGDATSRAAEVRRELVESVLDRLPAALARTFKGE